MFEQSAKFPGELMDSAIFGVLFLERDNAELKRANSCGASLLAETKELEIRLSEDMVLGLGGHAMPMTKNRALRTTAYVSVLNRSDTAEPSLEHSFIIV